MEYFGLNIGLVPPVKIINFIKECVIKDYIKNAKLIDTSPKFLLENMPRGEKLDTMVMEYMDTLDGSIMVIQLSLNIYNNDITEDKIEKFINEVLKVENKDIVNILVNEILGKVDDPKKNLI